MVKSRNGFEDIIKDYKEVFKRFDRRSYKNTASWDSGWMPTIRVSQNSVVNIKIRHHSARIQRHENGCTRHKYRSSSSLSVCSLVILMFMNSEHQCWLHLKRPDLNWLKGYIVIPPNSATKQFQCYFPRYYSLNSEGVMMVAKLILWTQYQ